MEGRQAGKPEAKHSRSIQRYALPRTSIGQWLAIEIPPVPATTFSSPPFRLNTIRITPLHEAGA